MDWVPKKLWHKALAGVAVTIAFGSGGVVVTDASINPYTTVGDKLEIAAESKVDSAGEVKTAAITDKPAIELSKWSGHANMQIEYLGIASTTQGSRPLLSKNVEWTEGSQKMEAVPLDPSPQNEDGGMEINIILDAPPASNVFPFKISGAENMDFAYQTPYWQEAGLKAPTQDCTDTDCVVRGHFRHRDENISGSYTVFSITNKDHLEGQLNYAAGKLFQIYRPLVTDAKNNTIWGDLSYNEGVLSVSVPQAFLDGATYPIKIDPQFGNTTNGASQIAEQGPDNSFGQLFNFSTVQGVTVTKITARLNNNGSGTRTFDVASYTYASSSPQARIGSAVSSSISSASATNVDVTVSNVMTGGIAYTTAIGNWDQTNILNIYYDNGPSGTVGTNYDTSTGSLNSAWVNSNTTGIERVTLYSTYSELSRTVDTSAFTYCRTLTSNNDGYTDGIATTTTGLFPLIATSTLSTLAATSSSGHVSSLNSGSTAAGQTPLDIVFVDEASCSFNKGATAIPHFFENYTSTTGQFVVHLGTSNISSTSAKTLAMYYGVSTTTNLNSPGQVYATTSPLTPAGIWTLGLPGVATTTTPDFLDSTYNYNHGGSSALTPSTAITTGYLDGAVKFDGSDDIIVIPAAASIDTNIKAMTVLAWVNFSSLANAYSHIAGEDNSGNANYFVPMVKSNGKLAMYLTTNNPVSYDGTGVNTLSTGNWYHIAMSYDKAVGLKGYVNGSLDGSAASTNNDVSLAVNSAFYIGASAFTPGRFVNGTIDDVRAYATALTSSDVKTIYNNENNSAVFWTIGSETTQGGPAPVTTSSKIIQMIGQIKQTLGKIFQP